MEKFGIILCLIGFMGVLCLIGYAIYISYGGLGLVSYISILCLAVGGTIMAME